MHIVINQVPIYFLYLSMLCSSMLDTYNRHIHVLPEYLFSLHFQLLIFCQAHQYQGNDQISLCYHIYSNVIRYRNVGTYYIGRGAA